MTKSFALMTYNTYAGMYEEGRLDNQINSNFNIRYGNAVMDVLTLYDKNNMTKSL